MRVICVDYGNLCRSPMAAELLGAAARGAGLAVSVTSAGTVCRHRGDPADPLAIAAMAARGHDIARHRARRLSETMMREADLLLGVDRPVLARLARLLPEDARARIAPFHPSEEIADPYYEDDAAFERALDLIAAAVPYWLARWAEPPALPEGLPGDPPP
jgi:protein-tyrosine phosphatase